MSGRPPLRLPEQARGATSPPIDGGVVEIDGSQHVDSEYDRRCDEFMRSKGYSVLRFWNVDVLKERHSVCETILAALEGQLTENVIARDLRYVHASQSMPEISRS